MIWIILPAFNEADNLRDLLPLVKRAMEQSGLGDYRLVVVDDGSTDRTAEVVRSLSDTVPVDLISNPQNLGLPETLKRGLAYAVERVSDPEDILVTMDADSSHLPGLILRMVRRIREGNDIVIASRYRYGSRVRGLSPFRTALSTGASILFRLTFPIAGVRDYTCGYRAYRGGLLQRVFEELGPDQILSERGFSCMVDILLKMRAYDPIITEVPMVLRYDLKRGQSKMDVPSTVLDTLRLIARRRLWQQTH